MTTKTERLLAKESVRNLHRVRTHILRGARWQSALFENLNDAQRIYYRDEIANPLRDVINAMYDLEKTL